MAICHALDTNVRDIHSGDKRSNTRTDRQENIHTSTWVSQSIYLGNGHVIYKVGILDYSVQHRFTLNMGNKIILLMLGIKS